VLGRDRAPSEGAISAARTAPALREEAQPLAKYREVACFLAAGRKPVAIKVEAAGSRLSVLPQRRAAPRNVRQVFSTGFDLLAVPLDRLVGPDTKVHAIIGGRRRTPLGTPDIEGRTCVGVHASGLAPRDEPLDGGTERRRIAPMLHDRHRRGGHIAIVTSSVVIAEAQDISNEIIHVLGSDYEVGHGRMGCA